MGGFKGFGLKVGFYEHASKTSQFIKELYTVYFTFYS
jgi:hypothetical protein